MNKQEQTQYFPEIIPFREGDQWGYTDRKKNFIVTPRYTQTFPFVGNLGRVAMNDKVGLVDRDGKEILPPEFDFIDAPYTDSFLGENGTFLVGKDEKYGLVSCYGDILTEVKYMSEEEATEAAAQKGWVSALPASHFPKMPQTVAKQIAQIKPFKHGIAPFKKNGKWGLITEDGKEVAAPQYDDISAPENSYYPFLENGAWGLLDADGNKLIDARFEEARGFSNGQAACKQEGLWGAIDQSGNWVVQPQYEELGEFRDGLSAAQKNGLFGFIDEAGNTVLDFQYQDVMDFDEKACAVFENEFIYFIDIAGKAISDRYVRMFGPHEGGLMHVVADEKWGLVKPNGKFILPVQYDLPRAMGQVLQTIENGMIPIKRGPLLGYANAKGEEVVSPKYMMVDPYQEGLSLVSTLHERLNFGKTPEDIEATGSISGVFNFGFIDASGNEVVTPQYVLARRFEYGLAFVETQEQQFGYITYDGTEYFDRYNYAG